MQISLSKKIINSKVILPASKSVSNRALIINALYNNKLSIKNLSDSDDTQVLQKALNSEESMLNLSGSGTAFRFLTAFYAATTHTEKILTCNARMSQRPVGELVNAINLLGGKIQFLGKNGFPPVKIFPSVMQGGKIELVSSVSSQFASALLLIAPVLKNGLRLHLKGETVSALYIDMTLKVLDKFGISYIKNENCIEISNNSQSIEKQEIKKRNQNKIFVVENDWTAASYFYQILSVAGEGEIFFPKLKIQSIQGDKIIAEIFENLGIRTHNRKDGIKITATAKNTDYLNINLINNPDLVQTLTVTCCLKNIPFYFSGIKNLKIKETDRVAALIAECRKIGCILTFEEKENALCWNGQRADIKQNIQISTYDDHRMAMSFAAVSLLFPLEIQNAAVVTKSFPHFWQEFFNLQK